MDKPKNSLPYILNSSTFFNAFFLIHRKLRLNFERNVQSCPDSVLTAQQFLSNSVRSSLRFVGMVEISESSL
jgi:hypothetical protein